MGLLRVRVRNRDSVKPSLGIELGLRMIRVRIRVVE